MVKVKVDYIQHSQQQIVLEGEQVNWIQHRLASKQNRGSKTNLWESHADAAWNHLLDA